MCDGTTLVGCGSYSRVDIAEAKTKVLANQLPALEAQMKELEAKLDRTWDSIADLELCMEDREAKLMEWSLQMWLDTIEG